MIFEDSQEYFDLSSWEVANFLNKEGKRILELLIERDGLHPTLQQVEELSEYLSARFGHTEDLDWYLASVLTHGKFVEALIPPREYSTKLYPLLNEGVAKMTEVKSFANRVLPTDQLLDVGYLIDGNFYNRDYKIAHLESLEQRLGPGAMIFVKRDCSRGGRHSYLVSIEDFANSPHEIGADWVIQRVQQPAPGLAAIGGERAVTIRVITLRDAEGHVSSPSASLIIGGERAELRNDNPTIEVLFRDQLGRLDHLGFDEDLRRYSSAGAELPKFGEVQIDHFDTALRFVENLHRFMPKFDILSWDLTIDQDGKPWLYEWSGDHVDIRLSQIRGGIPLVGLRHFSERTHKPFFKDSVPWDEDESGKDVIDFGK